MEERLKVQAARRACSASGFSLLIYYGIMNVAVIMAMLVDMVIYLIRNFHSLDMDSMMDYMIQSAYSNGWGYLAAIVIGGAAALLWKKKAFWTKTVFYSSKKMTFGAFIQILSVFVAIQAVLQLIAPVMEGLLNLFGLSAMAAMETASMSATGFSMFIYLSFLGPVAEELLFRGLVLRILEPHGKQTAILVSALFFGLFHGNVVQIPFAFLIGLVLAYVTLEYSIVWAIVLHIFNNFVLSDLLTRLSKLVPNLGEIIFLVIIAAAAIASIVLLLVRRKEVAEYFKENRLSNSSAKALVTSPGALVFSGLMMLMSLFSITFL